VPNYKTRTSTLRARAPRLKKDVLHAGENQFAHRASICSGLRFELAIERRGDIDRGANAIRLHKGYCPMCAINMERKMMCQLIFFTRTKLVNEIGAGKIRIKT
jgi:hypothetical protein